VRPFRTSAAVALCVLGAALAACAPHSATTASAPSAPPATSATPETTAPARPAPWIGQASRVIDLSDAMGDNAMQDVAVAGGKLYTSSQLGVLSIDQATGHYTVLAKAPTLPGWLIQAGSDLWVQYPSENILRRISLSNGRITAQVQLDSDMSTALATTPGSVWTLIHNGEVLVRIDTRTGAIASRVTIDDAGGQIKPEGLSAVGTAVFVVAMSRHQIVEVDAAGSVSRTWSVPFQPCTAVPATNLTMAWVFDCTTHELYRLDLASGATSTVAGVDELIGPMVSFGGDGLWVTMLAYDRSSTFLMHLTPDGTIDNVIDMQEQFALGVVAAPGGLWVASPPGLRFFGPNDLKQ
jgi:hypothetical protein